MCKLVGALFLLGLGAVFGHPAKDKLMIDVGGDTAVVESTVREARQVPERIEELLQPGVKDAFIHTYGDKQGDAGDVQGYSKKLNDRGNDGYQHFDSYHKKDADKYGYEVHKEFGKSDSANVDTTDENGKYADGDDKNAEGEESQTLYRISGESKENKKNKNSLDDFDFVYFGGNGGSGKSAGDGATAESDGGKAQSYEVNDSYSEGGSSSYSEGDDGESGTSGSGSYSSGGESGHYTSADDEDADGHEEAEGDDY